MPTGKGGRAIVSQAQRGAMYAAAAGKSTLGISRAVGRKLTNEDRPGKLPRALHEKPHTASAGHQTFSHRTVHSGGRTEHHIPHPQDGRKK